MAQIKTKNLESNAVTGTKVRLDNNQALRARNAANSGDVNLFKLDASDIMQFLVHPEISAAPTTQYQVANKAYVDSVTTGLDIKPSVRLATAAALPAYTAAGSGIGKTLTADAVGVLTVDGVATVLNDRILVKSEGASHADHGIYKVTTEGTAGVAFVLTRAVDADEAAEVTAGMFTFVEAGSTNADTGWVLTTNNTITLDTTALAFSQFSASTAITAGAGLLQTGNAFDVVAGDNSITVNANDLVVKRATGATLGNIIVDASGITTDTDGSTIETASNKLQVKNAGITSAKLAAAVAGDMIAGGAGTALSVDLAAAGGLESSNPGNTAGQLQINVDATNGTSKINASNELEATKQLEELFTLSGTDITNQYVDLAHKAIGSSASVNSVSLFYNIAQIKGTDYTVSLTGGGGGVTRVTFAGDLATGGASELVATDKIIVSYSYL